MKTIRYQLKSLRKSPAFIQNYSFISSRTTTKYKYKKQQNQKEDGVEPLKPIFDSGKIERFHSVLFISVDNQKYHISII